MIVKIKATKVDPSGHSLEFWPVIFTIGWYVKVLKTLCQMKSNSLE